MSEYQYYEFQAVDRPLTPKEMSELRALSTRAHISPTRFQNVYNWGDFKGDPSKLMERYFDAFVYVANWGTNWLMLRLPSRALDLELAQQYVVDGGVTLRVGPDHVILDFLSEDEEGVGWIEDEESESWMPALMPLRAELAMGDFRCLYLAWLAGTQTGMLDEDEAEPPLPAGLGDLSASLTALARFLRVDEDLIAVAAERSPVLQANPSPADVERWVRSLSIEEKDDILIRLTQGDDRHLQAEMMRRYSVSTGRASVTRGERTVGELLTKASEGVAARRQREREWQAAERVCREREAAAAREKYLDSLAGREAELWRQVEALIETKQPAKYDRAVQVLRDLHDLAARERRVEQFVTRFEQLRARYARRPSLLKRLDAAGVSDTDDGSMLSNFFTSQS